MALPICDWLHGLSHPVSAELSSRAKTYLQNTGGFLSSREAEDHLVRLGLLPAVFPERLYQGDAAAKVRAELRGALPAATDADLFLAPSGMNAVWAAFQAASALQASRGRTVWLQLGWLYLDTIAILQRFTGGPENYVHLRDPLDLRAVEQALAAHGTRVAGVIAEVPTNPLIQTTDVPALAALCRRQGALLIVDPSIASVHHVDALPHADLVVASLTKYTASEGDLTAGLVAVNAAGRDAAALREQPELFATVAQALVLDHYRSVQRRHSLRKKTNPDRLQIAFRPLVMPVVGGNQTHRSRLQPVVALPG